MPHKESLWKRFFHALSDVVVTVFLILGFACVLLSVFSKKDEDGTVRFLNYEMRIVISPSMERCDSTDVSAYEIQDIPVKSMIFIQTVPEGYAAAEAWYDSLKVGDVLTFRYVYTSQETITHRIVDIREKEKGYYVYLEGDNKADETGVLRQVIDTAAEDDPNYIIGKVVGVSVWLGYVIYALKQPVAMALLIIVPCVIIIIMEVLRISDVLGEEKRKKEEERRAAEEAEKAQRDAEIELLKAQVAALQKAADAEKREE